MGGAWRPGGWLARRVAGGLAAVIDEDHVGLAAFDGERGGASLGSVTDPTQSTPA